MNRTTRVLGFSVPPAMVKEVQALAKEEHRTKSELFREMVRVYRRYRLQRDRDEERWISGLIEEVRAEERQRPTSPTELAREDADLAAYGVRQARSRGIKPGDVNRLIREFRAQNRP